MSTIDERRRELIRILEEVVPESDILFDMSKWYHEYKFGAIGGLPPVCGTAACALGSFCYLSPMAKKDGFVLISDTPYLEMGGADREWWANPFGYEAAEEYFDMDDEEAWQLFSSDGWSDNVTPVEVARYARELWGIE